MRRQRGWHTPDAQEGSDIIVRPLFVPVQYLPIVAGALAELTMPWNWEQVGTTNASVASSDMAKMLHEWVNAGGVAAVMFRLTEECMLQSSVDEGATWVDVPGWNNLSACFPATGPAITATVLNEVEHDDPPSLNFNAATKTLTLDLPALPPVDEPGPAITATVLNPVAYNAPASLNFNAATKTLTLDLPAVDEPELSPIAITEVQHSVSDVKTSMTYDPLNRKLTLYEQSPWLRGVRSRIYEEWIDVQTMPPNIIEMNTYANPDVWVPLVVIPPYERPKETDGFDDEPSLETNEVEVACGQATKIMEGLQAHWAQLMEILSTAADVAEAIGEVVELFYALGAPIAIQFAADGITSAFTIGESVLNSTFTPAHADAMLCKLHCLIIENGGFNKVVYEGFAEWAYETYTGPLEVGARAFGLSIKWVGLSYIKRLAFLGSLDPLATCALCDCDGDGDVYAWRALGGGKLSGLEFVPHSWPGGCTGTYRAVEDDARSCDTFISNEWRSGVSVTKTFTALHIDTVRVVFDGVTFISGRGGCTLRVWNGATLIHNFKLGAQAGDMTRTINGTATRIQVDWEGYRFPVGSPSWGAIKMIEVVGTGTPPF